MKRSKHSLSHYVLSTFDMGELVPIGHYEVLPGDSIRHATSCLLRVSPLIAPVMHPVTVRVHHWFVPYRIIWDEWEAFITGGANGEGDGAVFPFMSFTPAPGTLGDYLGTPVGLAGNLSALPFRAYTKIFNEFYRDQDLQGPRPEVTAGGSDSSTLDTVESCAWEKDYFTSARPWTQKGPDVTVPVDGIVTTSATDLVSGAQAAMRLKTTAGATPGQNVTLGTGAGAASPELSSDVVAGFAADTAYYPSNLEVAAASASINDFRLAFALQRYQEARAQYGSRYTEYLRYLGVRSSDARLQRPEYLGGGRSTISFSEVLKTGEGDTPADDAPIGELRGHGISAMRSRRYIRFFEEHGIVMTLASVRSRSIYEGGLHRSWSRRTKEDFWQKELEQIGQQAVLNKEIFADHATPQGVFGYQDRYAEYRHHPSYVVGDFRSTMSDWHLARIFASDPALNADFVKCVPSKRIHAEQTTDVLWSMFSHSIQARRMVGKRTIGRLF